MDLVQFGIIFIFLLIPVIEVIISLLGFSWVVNDSDCALEVIRISFAITFALISFLVFGYLRGLNVAYIKLPELPVNIMVLIDNISCIVGPIVAIGLLLAKNVFRKIAIILISYDLCFIVIALFIQDLVFHAKLMNIELMRFIYDIAFIYFFTRPKVKEQFK